MSAAEKDTGIYTVEHMKKEIKKRLEKPESWKQERPSWCPHQDCIFLRQTQGLLCGGELPKPEPHDEGENTHRLCIKAGEVFDLQVNKTDCDGIRFILDALDGKKTSWRSKGDKIMGKDYKLMVRVNDDGEIVETSTKEPNRFYPFEALDEIATMSKDRVTVLKLVNALRAYITGIEKS